MLVCCRALKDRHKQCVVPSFSLSHTHTHTHTHSHTHNLTKFLDKQNMDKPMSKSWTFSATDTISNVLNTQQT